MPQGLIKYIAIISLILIVVFLSQQAYSSSFGKALISGATEKATAYLAKGSEWASANIYSKIGGELEKRGEAIKNEANTEKENVSENFGEKISNYFSGIVKSIVNPGENNSCQPSQTSAN